MVDKKVLIIDDDSRNIFALSATLRAKGYSCLSASGAAEGMNMLHANHNIGIVLMDMMMPDMDGYEAISLIKKNEATSRIPVIAVTAQAMVGDRDKCLAAGADAYISKPVNVDMLVQYLQEFVK